MSNDEICMANRCLHWSIYWDEETDEYYECCSAAYDTPKESIPENCPCIDEFTAHALMNLKENKDDKDGDNKFKDIG